MRSMPLNSSSGPRCPICREPTDSAEPGVLPFCSLRCKQIDLRRWLGESYAVPERKPLDEDELEFEE